MADKPVPLNKPLEAATLAAESLEEQDYSYLPPAERSLLGIENHPTLVFWWANISVRNDTSVSLTTYRRHLADGLVQINVKDFPELAATRPDLVDGDRFIQDGQVLMAMPKQRGSNRIKYYEDQVDQGLNVRNVQGQFANDAVADHRAPVALTTSPRLARFSSRD